MNSIPCIWGAEQHIPVGLTRRPAPWTTMCSERWTLADGLVGALLSQVNDLKPPLQWQNGHYWTSGVITGLWFSHHWISKPSNICLRPCLIPSCCRKGVGGLSSSPRPSAQIPTLPFPCMIPFLFCVFVLSLVANIIQYFTSLKKKSFFDSPPPHHPASLGSVPIYDQVSQGNVLHISSTEVGWRELLFFFLWPH